MPEVQIKEALNKAFIKVRPERAAIEQFKNNFINLLDRIKTSPDESEEFLKNLISDFLKKTYYGENYFVNTKERMDLVIHTGSDAKTSVGVIIEAKKPGNKHEMISKENLNAKSLQELLLYYFRETIDNKNVELKHLIVTNTIEWFIFDAQNFFHVFSQDKKLIELYDEYKNGALPGKNTDFFYTKIASPAIEKKQNELSYTYFNITDYESIIRDTNKDKDNKLISLYKLFSPEHLLKLPFVNDSNTLNQVFYTELLYLLGLSEEKDGGKKIIVRNKEGERKEGSLIENTIFQLSDYPLKENELFDIALELTITWINRILFLKLLESQQLSYRKGNADYAFLNIEKVKNYTDLNTLFFKVLALELKNRPDTIKNRFKNIPYLNSSLFDMTETEKKYFSAANLPETEIPVFSGTVLKDNSGNKQKGKINTLKYIFDFLEAYDFSSEGSEEIQEENKTLISASVLGLIFEKINGYKDGSFFTPGFITTYICREAIRQVVIDKFNELKNWKVKSFDELKNYVDNKSIADIKEANDIINSITICDPAVGSGHFLVSALNEIIAVKSDLGILADSKGVRLKNFTADVVNDELMIFDEDRNFFVYNVNNAESRRIQETIFKEKRRIIEGSLFGVDINPNSVKICRLRLWIELLKNTFYTEESGYNELETLPNLDINIKCGNSLISRFDLDIDLKAELSKLKYTVKNYQEAVQKYKYATAKNEKQELENLIKAIKDNFRGGVINNSALSIKKGRFLAELASLTQGELFILSPQEQAKKEKRINEIAQKIKEIEQQIEEFNNNVIYENAFEWRFEFPEVLNDNGDFAGFDVIIGNPPYIQLQDNHGELADIYSRIGYECFSRSGDIYQLFYECGYKLLKEKRYLCFITSNKWMRAAYGEKTRNFFANNTNPRILIDFAGQKVFESATVDVNIILLEKKKNEQQTISCIIKDDCKNNMTDYIKQNSTTLEFPSGNSWVILNPIEKRIKDKIEHVGVPLKDWDISINYGIKTGCNEVFIIDKTKRDELIAKDPKSAEIIRPILRGRDIKRYGYEFAEQYIIATFPSRKIDIDDYPAVRDYLLEYGKEKLEQSGKPGARKKTPHKWYETQDTINYWDDFFKQKIVYPNMTKFIPFYFDNNGFFQNDKSFMVVGKNIAFLTAFFNSSIFKYCFLDNFPELQGGTRELRKVFFDKIPVLQVNNKINNLFETKIIELQIKKEKNLDTKDEEIEIDNMIFELYQLSEKERNTIGYIEIF